MSQVYKITEEEINQTILHSPYSLADSPAKAGMKAVQIKKFFYEFIRFFAEKINIHLDDIGDGFDSTHALIEQLWQKISELEESDTALGSSCSSQISAHNQSAVAHQDIRRDIVSKLIAHNSSATSHQDMRAFLKELRDKLNATYALASGKQTVYPCQSELDALEQIYERNDISVGDLFLVADDESVDFTVFEVGYKDPSDIEISYEQIANGEITLEAGKMYYFAGVRLFASQGNLETGLLAKQIDLEELENSFLTNSEAVGSKLTELEAVLKEKQDKLNELESTAEEITLESYEYNLGLKTSLSLSLGETDNLEAIINFRSGATPTSFDAPSEILFQGDDTLNGRLYPVSNRLYEINIKNVMGVLVAKVGATDFEVIE